MAILLPGTNLGQVVHTHVLLSPSGLNWYQSNGSNASRLERSLAMHHTLKVVYPATGSRPSEDDSTSPMLLVEFDNLQFHLWNVLACVVV